MPVTTLQDGATHTITMRNSVETVRYWTYTWGLRVERIGDRPQEDTRIEGLIDIRVGARADSVLSMAYMMNDQLPLFVVNPFLEEDFEHTRQLAGGILSRGRRYLPGFAYETGESLSVGVSGTNAKVIIRHALHRGVMDSTYTKEVNISEFSVPNGRWEKWRSLVGLFGSVAQGFQHVGTPTPTIESIRGGYRGAGGHVRQALEVAAQESGIRGLGNYLLAAQAQELPSATVVPATVVEPESTRQQPDLLKLKRKVNLE